MESTRVAPTGTRDEQIFLAISQQTRAWRSVDRGTWHTVRSLLLSLILFSRRTLNARAAVAVATAAAAVAAAAAAAVAAAADGGGAAAAAATTTPAEMSQLT